MENSHIQWTNATANFWIGCHKVSPGCKYCYMYRLMQMYGKDPYTVNRTKDSTFYAPLKWKEPKMIFTCSWSDFFVEDADGWRADAWDVIRKTPHHTWQILTKRPERILQCLPNDWEDGWDNVWIGVSVENQDYMHRAATLTQIPVKTRFISAEPLLGPLDFSNVLPSLDWIIVGGESGNDVGQYRYRECKAEWIEQIVKDTKQAGASVFVKQLGTHLAKQYGCKDRKGGNMDEWPAELDTIKVREYPNRVA